MSCRGNTLSDIWQTSSDDDDDDDDDDVDGDVKEGLAWQWCDSRVAVP